MELPAEIEIEVKKEHINFGARVNCHSCPIALAIKEKLNLKEKQVSVAASGVFLFTDIDNYDYDLPQEALDFILDYDGGNKKIVPFKFIMKRVKTLSGYRELES